MESEDRELSSPRRASTPTVSDVTTRAPIRTRSWSPRPSHDFEDITRSPCPQDGRLSPRPPVHDSEDRVLSSPRRASTPTVSDVTTRTPIRTRSRSPRPAHDYEDGPRSAGPRYPRRRPRPPAPGARSPDQAPVPRYGLRPRPQAPRARTPDQAPGPRYGLRPRPQAPRARTPDQAASPQYRWILPKPSPSWAGTSNQGDQSHDDVVSASAQEDEGISSWSLEGSPGPLREYRGRSLLSRATSPGAGTSNQGDQSHDDVVSASAQEDEEISRRSLEGSPGALRE